MLIEVKDLKVWYESAEVLKGISFNVDAGEIVTLIGGNGAGKTTTLRAISGLKSLTAGEIWFENRRIDGFLPQNIVKLGIFHVSDNRALFPYMSVIENLKLGAFLRRDRFVVRQDLDNILMHFPILGKRRRQLASTLSGGEQQMLAIAVALMGSPKLLMLDEPSSGLAPIIVDEIGKIILEINTSGTTILLVEQNAGLALHLAFRGYVLEVGSIIAYGKVSDLLCNEMVKKAYLGV